MGFVLQCSLAIDDLEKGHDAGQQIDNPLAGSPKAVIALLYHGIPVLARMIFPKEFAAEVNQCFLKAVEKTKELGQEGR